MSKRAPSFCYSKDTAQETLRISSATKPSSIPISKNYAKRTSSSPRQSISFRTCSTRSSTTKPTMQQAQKQQQISQGNVGHFDEINEQDFDVHVAVQPEKQSGVELNNVMLKDKPINDEEMKKALEGLIPPHISEVFASVNAELKALSKQDLSTPVAIQPKKQSSIDSNDVTFVDKPINKEEMKALGELIPPYISEVFASVNAELKALSKQDLLAPVAVQPEKQSSNIDLNDITFVDKPINEEEMKALEVEGLITPYISEVFASVDAKLKALKEKIVNEEEHVAGMMQEKETVEKTNDYGGNTCNEYISDMDTIYAPNPLRIDSTNSILPGTLKRSNKQSYLKMHRQKLKEIGAKTHIRVPSEKVDFNSEATKDPKIDHIAPVGNTNAVLPTSEISNQTRSEVKADGSSSTESLLEDTKPPPIVYKIVTDCDEPEENDVNLNGEAEVELVNEPEVKNLDNYESKEFIPEASKDLDPNQIHSLGIDGNINLPIFKVSTLETSTVKPKGLVSKECLEDTKVTSIDYDIPTDECDSDEWEEHYDNLRDEPEGEFVEIFELTLSDTDININMEEYEKLSSDYKKPGTEKISPAAPSPHQKKKQRTIFSMDVQPMLDEERGDSVLIHPSGEDGDWSGVLPPMEKKISALPLVEKKTSVLPPMEKKKPGLELVTDHQHPIQRKSSGGFTIENVTVSTVHIESTDEISEKSWAHELKQDPPVIEPEIENTLSQQPQGISISPQNSTLILSPRMINDQKVFATSVKIHNASANQFGYKILCNRSAINHFRMTPKMGFIHPHSQISIKVQTSTENLVTSEVAAVDKISITIFRSYCDDVKNLRKYYELLSEQRPESISTQYFERIIIWDAGNLTEMLKLLNSIKDPEEVAYLKESLYSQYKNEVIPQVQRKRVLNKMWIEMLTMNQNLRNVYSQMVDVKNIQTSFLCMFVTFAAFYFVVPFLSTDVVVEEEIPPEQNSDFWSWDGIVNYVWNW